MKAKLFYLLIICVFLLFSLGFEQPVAEAPDYTAMSTVYLGVWNTGDVDVYDDLLTPVFERHTSPNISPEGLVSGIEAMKEHILHSRQYL